MGCLEKRPSCRFFVRYIHVNNCFRGDVSAGKILSLVLFDVRIFSGNNGSVNFVIRNFTRRPHFFAIKSVKNEICIAGLNCQAGYAMHCQC